MIETTVIGSYPVTLDGAKYAKAYFEDGKSNAPEESIRQAVSKQVEAGIDIVSDGQTRGNFVNIFARNFRGALIQSRPIVIGELEYGKPATVDDLRLVRKLIPKKTKLKGIITGPYTMARNSENRHYGSVKELAFAYAEGLAKEASALDAVVDYIQVDEPYFSVDYPEYGRELTEKVFGTVKAPRMLHVCGDVSKVFSRLVEYKVDFLEHEFAANPGLWDALKGVDYKQRLGVGVVRSDDNKVEPVEEIASRMRTALKRLPAERLLFNPDCGLRNLDPDKAYAKLKNMVKARDMVGRL